MMDEQTQVQAYTPPSLKSLHSENFIFKKNYYSIIR